MKVSNNKDRDYRTDRLGLVLGNHMSSAVEQGICYVPLLVDDSGEFTICIGEGCAGTCSEATDAPKGSILDSHCTSVSQGS